MATPVDNKQIEKRGAPEEVKQDSLLLKMLPAPVILEILKHATTSLRVIPKLKRVCKLWNEILRFSFMPIMSKVFGLPTRNPFSQPSTNTKIALAENLHNHAKDIAEIMSSNRPQDIGPFINYDLSNATRSEKLHYLKQATLKNKEDLVKIFSDGLSLSRSEKFEYLKEAVLVNNKAIIQFFSDDLTLSDAEKKELIPLAIQSGNMDIISDIKLESLTRADKINYLYHALQFAHTNVIDFFFNMCPNDLTGPEIDKLVGRSILKGYLPLVEKHYVNVDKDSQFYFLRLAHPNEHNEKVIKFIFENRLDLTDAQTEHIIKQAIHLGLIDVLKQFDFDHFDPAKIFHFLSEAIDTGHEDIIHFFFNKYPNLSEDETKELFKHSVELNKVASTNFLLNHVMSDPINACINALELISDEGREVAQFLINRILADESAINRIGLAHQILDMTAQFGFLDQMRAILEKKPEDPFTRLPKRLLTLSTAYGQFEVMDYTLSKFSNELTPEDVGQALPSIAKQTSEANQYIRCPNYKGFRSLLSAFPAISLDHVKKVLQSSMTSRKEIVEAILKEREDIFEDSDFIEQLTDKKQYSIDDYYESTTNIALVKEAYEDHKLSKQITTLFESKSE